MIRLLPWLLATGLLVPAAARAQQEIKVLLGEEIPNLRACVDYIGRGALRSVGKPRATDDPDDVIGHAVYRFHFAERAEIVGHSAWRSAELARVAHDQPDVRARDALIFMSEGRFRDWQPVWQDRAGKAFVPIFGWPDPENRNWWVPLAIRRFARPVSYDWPRLRAEGERDETDEPDIYVKRGARWYVRYGLYLRDIPAMFEAAKAESCWR